MSERVCVCVKYRYKNVSEQQEKFWETVLLLSTAPEVATSETAKQIPEPEQAT